MNFFISDAMAQAEQAGSSGLIEFIVMIVIFFAIMYFLIIRPQSKRAKEHKEMVDALSKGDEVVTNGGLLGKVTELDDAFIKVEVAEGTIVSIQRHSVAAVMPKGTMKAL